MAEDVTYETVGAGAPWETIEAACRLHIEGLDYRSFITKLGHRFLCEYYQALLNHGKAFLVISRLHGEIVGFILASNDSSQMFRFPLLTLIRLGIFAGLGLLKSGRPFGLARQILKVFTSYADLASSKVKSELVAIVVTEKARSRQIGHYLVEKLVAAFGEKGVQEFKVTVHKVMDRSNHFYQKEGFVLSHSFKMEGDVIWNVYVRKTSG